MVAFFAFSIIFGVYVLFMVFNKRLLAKCGDGKATIDGDDDETSSIVNADAVKLESGDNDNIASDAKEKKRKQPIPHMMTVTEDDNKDEEDEEKSLYDKFDILCIPWTFVFSYTIPDAGETSEYRNISYLHLS